MPINRSFRKSKRYQKKSKSIKKYNRFASMRGGTIISDLKWKKHSLQRSLEDIHKLQLQLEIAKVAAEKEHDYWGEKALFYRNLENDYLKFYGKFEERIKKIHLQMAEVEKEIEIYETELKNDEGEMEELYKKIKAVLFIINSHHEESQRLDTPMNYGPRLTAISKVFSEERKLLKEQLLSTVGNEFEFEKIYTSLRETVNANRNQDGYLIPGKEYAKYVDFYMETPKIDQTIREMADEFERIHGKRPDFERIHGKRPKGGIKK
jgi:hypothetical protein